MLRIGLGKIQVMSPAGKGVTDTKENPQMIRGQVKKTSGYTCFSLSAF